MLITGDHIASLIIGVEAPMTHCYTLEAGEQSLHDLCNRTQIFGRKLVTFAGDFRQMLPVVINESKNKRHVPHRLKILYIRKFLMTFLMPG